MSLFAPGRRWFAAGSITMIVVAALHTIGNTAGGPPPDAALQRVESAMQGYTLPLGMGMAPSIYDIFQSLVFTMSICLVGLGALGIALGSSAQVPAAVLTRVAWVLSAVSAALAVLSFAYRIPPPLISFVVTTVLFGIASFATKR
jgi:hypothetical protein